MSIQHGMASTRILVLDRNEALADQVRTVMTEVAGVTVEACTRVAEVGDLLTDDGPFDLLVAGPSLGTRAGLSRLELIHDELPTMSVVLAFSRRPTAALREIVRTGACDLLDFPIEDKDLQEALGRAIELAHAVRVPVTTGPATSPASTPGSDERRLGRVFSTSSATGGCGKTFLATNLAYYLAHHTGGRTCVIDLDLQFGEVTTALRLRPRYTIFDALQREDTDEADLHAHIDEYLVEHETGFWVLAAPKEPSEADHISSPDVTRIIEAVRTRFDYVVVDTPAALTEIVLAAFDLSDVLYTMATLDLPSVRNMGVFLNQLERLKIPSDNVRLILNKAERDVGIDVDQVTRLFPKQFSAVLPYAKEVSRSINLGMPVMASAPTAEISELMSRGLSDLLPPDARMRLEASRPTKAGLFARLFKR
ncbi:MAG: response regulator [Acidimicrobiales bacterium]